MGIARKLAHNRALPDPDLAAFLAGTPEMDAYRRDLFWAQGYALENRRIMLELYRDVLRGLFKKVTFEEAAWAPVRTSCAASATPRAFSRPLTALAGA